MAFFASGAAGLMYQVVWSRLLNEVFGISAYAIAAVLATYLGGLALGSSILARRADRHPRPLRFYGLLELGIAATAVAGAWLVRAVEPAHAWAASRLAPDSVSLVALRVALASAVVLPPTFLMGATLPAMTRALLDRVGTVGREVASLYALNTAGAVAGSLEVEAAAYASGARFDDAERAERRVLELALARHDAALAAAARQTLELYTRRLALPPIEAPRAQ